MYAQALVQYLPQTPAVASFVMASPCKGMTYSAETPRALALGLTFVRRPPAGKPGLSRVDWSSVLLVILVGKQAPDRGHTSKEMRDTAQTALLIICVGVF